MRLRSRSTKATTRGTIIVLISTLISAKSFFILSIRVRSIAIDLCAVAVTEFEPPWLLKEEHRRSERPGIAVEATIFAEGWPQIDN